VSDAIELNGGFQLSIPEDSFATLKISGEPEVIALDL
jgi:hypothetical protein